MKRFCTYNGLVAVAFLLLWVLLVVVEVKIRLFWFLGPLFFASLPLVFLCFFLASRRAFRGQSAHATGSAVLASAIMSPVFILVGVALATKLKLMIGGHI